mgnify:CR=1 FL=1|jgi:hypothetical protein|nr:MAG TPA: hypothetical protein [Caudoviricetes sp.]
MYNFNWNIYKGKKDINSSIPYGACFNREQSDSIFKDFEASYRFRNKLPDENEDAYTEWVESELIEITANYLSAIDPYNKLIDNTNINFNYINNEEKF